MKRKPVVLSVLFLAISGLMSVSALATEKSDLSVSIGIDMNTAPIYEGASAYSVIPLPAIEVVGVTDRWGIFTASFPDGLRWDLPTGNLFGIALLSHYDMGRKENIRTLNGKNKRLEGMGNLDGTLMAGLELSVNYGPFKGFVRGFKGLSDREYGGKDLGHTGYMEVGLNSLFPLTSTISMDVETFATWANREDMMSRFGVTQKQAIHSQFKEHNIGGGLKSVTLQWGLNWQFDENISFSGGAGLISYAASEIRNSPITEKNVDGNVFLRTMYMF